MADDATVTTGTGWMPTACSNTGHRRVPKSKASPTNV
jgi:hypothetical protein